MKNGTIGTVVRLAGLCASAAGLMLPLSAAAGIKYWDNPAYRAFDVDCYVQDRLVLNYDGIRNAGADAAHDPDATTWANLGTGGATYDMVRYSLADGAWADGAGAGAWTDKGFVFARDAIFHEMESFTVPTTYTIQTLVDATAGGQTGIGYIMCDYNDDKLPNSVHAGNWAGCCMGIRASGGGTGNNAFYAVSSQRPYFNAASATTPFSYATFIHDNAEGVMFPGTAAPWNATDGSYRSDLAKGPFERDWGISLGGHYPRTDETFTGTIKNFRFYEKRLSDEEVAWNRVVDEARYFGRTGALPVTNVVVASNVPVATGDEPVGCYAVDGSHIFSAPATKVVKGRTYALDGYTLETWDDATGTWGAPVPYPGESSFTATETSRFRLTWLWTAGDGLVRYDADDYVQYGLVLNYDGIRNAGLGAPHDSAATTWANLGSAGAAYDMTRYSLVSSAWTEGAAQGAWTDTGFTFGKNSVFNESTEIIIPTKRTMQVLVDARASDQSSSTAGVSTPIGDVVGCYNGTYWAYYTLCMRKSGGIANSFYLNAFNGGAAARPAIYNDNYTYDYGTAIVDGNDSVFFSGTTAPWSAASSGGTTGHYKNAGYTPVEYRDGGLSIGGRYPSQEERFTGTVKFFRFYDRCLTDAEVAWNRVVDDWRYAASAVTNVVVASTRGDVQASEPDGVYEVSGSYTFTAPAAATNASGIVYAPAGYAIQVWDAATGGWGAATEREGDSYAYVVGTSPAKVRLLWRWKAVRGLRTAADYDVSDYVAGGLVLNFDGIRNAGATADHDSAATTWVNIGTDGAIRNATLSGATDADWTENGYTFAGTDKFLVKNSTGVGTASHTVQFLTDAVQNEQQGYAGVEEPSNPSIFFFSGVQAAFAAAASGGSFYYRIQGNGNDGNLRFTFDKAKPLGYVTAITDAAEKKAYVFQGDAKPAAAPGVKSYETITTPSFGNLAIGGWGGGLTQYMRGGINCFRYYDRALSDAELAQNREVDQARFFGVLSVTNLVVEVAEGEAFDCDPAPGVYKVEGSYEFTVSRAEGGRSPVGYRLQDWDPATGRWTNARAVDSLTFSYDAATATAPMQRLVWRGLRPLVVVIR